MLVTRISGAQLHAARVLAGLSREDLAERARLCRQSIAKWENSSDAMPVARLRHLSRAIDVLEAEGVRFSETGVHFVHGPMPAISATAHSEAIA
jgi:transcriptional regulator with XRE-family HTH domain